MQGYLEEARDDLAKAEQHIREQHGDNCEKQLIVTYGNFAWVYYHMGEHVQSQTYLDKLEKIKKKFPTESRSALHPEIYGEKGRAFLKFSRQYYEKAKECFEKALELEPEEIEWNNGYAVALYRIECYNLTRLDESPASKQLRRVLELDPNNAYMMVLLGLKHADYKKYQKAEELIERAMELEPDKPNNGGEEAEALLRLRIQHLEKAISIKPSFVYAMSDLAACYAEEKNFRKAEEMFQESFKGATAKNDSLHVVNLRYADFQLYHNKSEPLAIKHYKEGLALQKNTAEGKKCAKKLTIIANKHISRNPHDGKAFGILGYVHKITGEKPQAIECYEKAILYDPGNEEYLNALYDLCLSLQ
ncbi:hypothetical protein SKAU_G00150090 [Synaphobranchus kaupii]|uniref:Interferon-induced protein with tetratricopeptide repeats 5 n=1 Tax=Synaphobranchus kaupii TaxID=118154 RepID=A0A9Q1FU87_SYNKA|nr:hypothetical protein SKAU_G00150090 [Synaphobranchus kaupii]